MAVTYRPFRGKTVSREWAIVLAAAADEGVRFTLNSGHRTMAEQQHLVDTQGLWSTSNPHGAAAPSATAPHIRTGRADHALDVDHVDGSADRLAAWLRSKGTHPGFPVSTENWHLELPGHELGRLARQLDDPLRNYTDSERAWIREYDRLKHADRGDARRRVLRRAMEQQRKRVWRAAQPHNHGGDGRGWDHANRRARYRSLLARTK
jgi:hypothetical protein